MTDRPTEPTNACGHPFVPRTGWLRLDNGTIVCDDCANGAERIMAMGAGPILAYVNWINHGDPVTTWLGGHLGRITTIRRWNGCTPYAQTRMVALRVRNCDGEWYGRLSADFNQSVVLHRRKSA